MSVIVSVCTVGIAVDGDSEADSVKPIVLVKRSGKVVELAEDISGKFLLNLLI